MKKYIRYPVEDKIFDCDLFSVRLDSFCLVKRKKKDYPLEMKVDFIHTSKEEPLEVHLKSPYSFNAYLVDNLHNQYFATNLENISEYAKEFLNGLGIRYSIYFPKLLKEAEGFDVVLKYSFRRPLFTETSEWSERNVVIPDITLPQR